MECIVKDLPVYYEEHGEGKPVLCLHGFAVDHRLVKGALEPVFEQESGYRRIYLDLPGMGQTPRRDWIENADVMLEVVKQFIAKVIGEESFLLVGNSYGGYLALGLASDPSLHIDGLFLMGPCVIADYTKRKLPVKGEAVIDPELKSMITSPADYENFLAMFVIATKENWHRFEVEILSGLRVADTFFLKGYRKRGYGFSFEDQLKELRFVKPICVLTGEWDDAVGYEDAWQLLKDLPQLTFVTLDGVGHNLHIENSEAFNLHLREWLRQI